MKLPGKYALPLLICFVLGSPVLARYYASSTANAVEVVGAEKRVIRETVLATGNLIYRDEALLSPEIIAKVRAVLVQEGDQVVKGQPIILLEEENLQEIVAQQSAQLAIEGATVQQQQAAVHNLNGDLQRMAALTDRGFASKSSYDRAYYALGGARAQLSGSELAVRRAQAALKQARFQLDRTVIRAPMSGTVVSVSIKPGETAVPSATGIPGSSLVTIARQGTIMVDLNVDENDVGRLAVGGEAEIICPTLPDNGIVGHVREIALAPRRAGQVMAANDATGRSYSVKVDASGEKSVRLRQGMSCRAKIYTSSPSPTVTVPVQAVLSAQANDDDGVSLPQQRQDEVEKYVFVVENGRASRRRVKTGKADDEYQQIVSGLRPGEQVVAGPYRVLKSLVDGAKVAPAKSR